MSILYVQQALKAAGYDPGPLDGLWGGKTKAALDAALNRGEAAASPVESRPVAPATDFDTNTKLLIQELERDEGRVLHAYQDHLGWWTIGIGRLIDKRKGGGITNEEADYLKANDVRKRAAELDRRYPWWRGLSPVRQRAMQNMAFQLGTAWPDEFKNTAALIRAGRFAEAGKALRQSLWHDQTPERSERVIRQWEQG